MTLNENAMRKNRIRGGECHGMAKFSDGDVGRIRDLLRAGVAQRRIAIHIGCSQQHVSLLNRNVRRTI